MQLTRNPPRGEGPLCLRALPREGRSGIVSARKTATREAASRILRGGGVMLIIAALVLLCVASTCTSVAVPSLNPPPTAQLQKRVSAAKYTFALPERLSLLGALVSAKSPIVFAEAVATTATTPPPGADDGEEGPGMGDVVLTTNNGIGRVLKEALIAAAITVAFLLPPIFDQLLMRHDAARYNGRKMEAILAGGSGGGKGAGTVAPPSALSPPPFLPLGISSHVLHGGYPIDGPREHLIYAKVNKKALEKRAAAAAAGKRGGGEAEAELLDLGPKPFYHPLTDPPAEEPAADGPAAAAGAVRRGLAPLVGHPPLIRCYHRRVDPSYAASVLCCLEEPMEARLPPMPVGDAIAEGGAAAAAGGKGGANNNKYSNDGHAVVEMTTVSPTAVPTAAAPIEEDPLLFDLSTPPPAPGASTAAPPSKRRGQASRAAEGQPADVEGLVLDDVALLPSAGPQAATSTATRKVVRKGPAAKKSKAAAATASSTPPPAMGVEL